MKRVRLYRKKWLLHLLLLLPLLTLLGIAYWDEREETREDYFAKALLPHAPQNLNLNAVKKITHSLEGRTHFSFVLIGDTRDNSKRFRKELKEALDHKPDFIIHTGDFTSSGKYKQYLETAAIIQHCPVPMVVVIGNHDSNNCGVQCFSHMFGPLNYYFDIGTYRFIFINDTSIEPEGRISNISDREQIAAASHDYAPGLSYRQIEGVEKLLQERDKNFIVMHIPPPVDVPLRFNSFSRNSKRFLEVMRNNASRIKGVFCGHYHGYGEFFLSGVTYTITGGGGARLYPPATGTTGKCISTYNYVLVDVRGGVVKHTACFPD